MRRLKNDQGFSIVEIVASIIIISIILLSFSQLIIQSNKYALKNNEKLVTINLADAILVKLKSQVFAENPTITDMNDYFKDNTEADPVKKNPPLQIKMNGKIYKISYVASQNPNKLNNTKSSEKELKLIKVRVTVTAPDNKTKGTTEGYVSLE